MQMGRHAAAQIVRLEGKTATVPFRYHDKGLMATIGRRAAVVQLAGGLRMRGTLAWLAWFALHLVYLLGGRNRVSTLVNLTFRYVAWGHGGAVIVGDEPPSHPAFTQSLAPISLTRTICTSREHLDIAGRYTCRGREKDPR